MKENNLIEEQELDNLLNTFFLKENAVAADLSIAGFIFAQEYDVVIDPKKEKKLLDRLNGKPKGGFGIKLFFSIFILAIIVGGIIFYLSNGNNATPPPENNPVTKETISIGMNDSTLPVSPAVQPGKIKAGAATQQIHTDFQRNLSPSFQNNSQLLLKNPKSIFPELHPDTTSYFTNDELIFYAGIKKEMLNRLLGIDENLYSKIEEGEVQYKNRPMPVDAFVIRNFSITNLEYKTFLADLVANGRTDDFTLAMVHPEIWNSYNCPLLKKNYFYDTKYNDFPVVNVSRAGADLFCNWLQQQINQFAISQNPKARQLKIRLPYDYEWIYAANEGYAEVPNCGGYNTIYDPSEGLVNGSFYKRLLAVKKRNNASPTEMDQLFATNRFGMNEKQITDIFEKGIIYKNSLVVNADYPNGISELNKAAHVSEIIQNENGGTIVMGACWKTKSDYSTMLNAFNASSGSPFVGFRIVISNAGKGTYKNPFW